MYFFYHPSPQQAISKPFCVTSSSVDTRPPDLFQMLILQHFSQYSTVNCIVQFVKCEKVKFSSFRTDKRSPRERKNDNIQLQIWACSAASSDDIVQSLIFFHYLFILLLFSSNSLVVFDFTFVNFMSFFSILFFIMVFYVENQQWMHVHEIFIHK